MAFQDQNYLFNQQIINIFAKILAKILHHHLDLKIHDYLSEIMIIGRISSAKESLFSDCT